MTENSYSVLNNTSNITAKLFIKRNDGYASSAYNLNKGDNSVMLKVGGSVKVEKNLVIDTRNNATVKLAEWTGDVLHASDGSLALSVEGSFTMDSPLTGGSVSAELSCTVIARATEIKLNSLSVTPGASVSVTLSPSDDAFNHKIKLSLGKKSLEESVSAGKTNAAVTVPLVWADEVTSSKSGNILVTLETYKGDTKIGSKNGNVTFKIPDTDEFLPSFSVNTEPVSDSVPEEWGLYVKGKSRVKVSLSDVTYKHSAVYSSVSVSVSGVKSTAVPSEILLTDSGSVNVTVTLFDSRGHKRTITKSIEVLDYSPPYVNFKKLYRCDENGEESASGKYLAAEFEKHFKTVGGKNSATVKLRYKKSGSSSYVTEEAVSSIAVFGEGAISQSSSYDVELLISDCFTDEPRSFLRRISSADIPFNIKSGGKGAAFGCYAETDNELTVAYDLNVCGKIKSEDVVSQIEISENVELVKGKVLYFKSLGAVFFNVRFVIKNDIAGDTETDLGKLSVAAPFCLTPLGVKITTTSAACTAYVTYDSRIKIKCSEAISANSWAYISGVVINYK